MKSVLIVEDYPVFRCLLRSILESEGLSCQEASNGEEAYAQLKERPIDIIITDHDMPRMNGIDLLKRLPQVYPEKLPLVIFLTGCYTKSLECEAKELGASVVFTKPLQVSDLLSYLADEELQTGQV